MKTALWIAASCLFLTLALPAQAVEVQRVPRYISVQGVLRDAGGTSIEGYSVSVDFKLFAAASSGTAIYSVSRSVTIVGGVFNELLGPFTDGVMAELEAQKQIYLEVNRSTDAPTGRVPLVSVPYAITAQTAGTANTADLAAKCDELTGSASNVECSPTHCISGGLTGDLALNTVTQDNLQTGSITTDAILDHTIQFHDINLYPDTGLLATTNCNGTNNVMKFDLSNPLIPKWVCAPDEIGTGTVKSLTVGAGFNQNGTVITTDGTISIGNGNITNDMLQYKAIVLAGDGVINVSTGTVTLGQSTTLSVGLVPYTKGGTGRATGCPQVGDVPNTLTWNDTAKTWDCTPMSMGNITKLTVQAPLSGGVIETTGTIGLSGIIPVLNGGTGLSGLAANKLYRGAALTSPASTVLVESKISDNGTSVGIDNLSGTAKLNVAGSTGSSTLALLMGAAQANLDFKSPSGDYVSIGSSTTHGIHFYNTGSGSYTDPAAGGIQIWPDTGLLVAKVLELDVIKSKPDVRTFTTPTASVGTDFVPVFFKDIGWADGPFVLEITRSTSPSVQARFRCHAPMGSGSDFCDADIHESGGTFVGGYQYSATTDAFVVWLLSNTAYSYRSPFQRVDDKISSTSYTAAGAGTYGGESQPNRTTAQVAAATAAGTVVRNGRRMDKSSLYVAANGSSCSLNAESTKVEAGPTIIARSGVVARGNLFSLGVPAGWVNVGTVAAKPSIDANPDNLAGYGIAIGSDGGFFSQSGGASSWLAFAGSNGIDMGAKPLINRGCPTVSGIVPVNAPAYAGETLAAIAFAKRGSVCISARSVQATYTLSMAAKYCGDRFGAYGAHLCSNSEMREAIQQGETTTSMDLVWISDTTGTTGGLIVKSTMAASNPFDALGTGTGSKVACCLSR